MADVPGSASAARFRYWRLRTFVAWSLVAHAGAGLAWGLPAYLSRQAARELEQARRAWSENLVKETVKAKEFAKEQKVETIRKQVEAQLKEQFDKLTQALAEAKREQLWKEAAAQLAKSGHAFAAALGNPEMSEQDLRNLEAQLQREMIEHLDQMLNADTAQDLAADFLAQVDSQVAPDLARWMQEQVRTRVAMQLREQADRLVREQRDDANRERDAGVQATREAQRHAGEADDLARRDREDAKRSQQRLQEAGQRLDAAAKQLDAADAHAPDLGDPAKRCIAAAKDAVAKAGDAVKAGAEAVGELRAQALAAADAALAKARQATRDAAEATAQTDGREQFAQSALKQTSERELKQASERTFTEGFRAETLPRLTPKLAKAFAEKLQANGIVDRKLVDAVAAKAGELLAEKVPELAKAGNQVQERFADLAPAAPPPAAAAAKPIDVGLAAQGGPRSELDRKLADGQAKLVAEAKLRMVGLAKDGGHDGEVVWRATGDGRADADDLDMRERIARLAEGMRSGRVGGIGASRIGSLRQGALLLSGITPHDYHAGIYKQLADRIADRGLIQGEQWQRSGADGETSRAMRTAGTVPARATGTDNAAAALRAGNTDPYQPTFKSLAFTAVPCLPDGFAIDGKAEKWAGIPAVPLKPEYGHDPSHQLMQLGWRADGLYARFAVKIPGRTLAKAQLTNFWDCDSVEVWIDCLNSKEKYRSRHAGQQFWIWPDGSANDQSLTGGESVVEKRGGGYAPRTYHQAELQRAATMTPDGYVVEFRIAADRLVDAELAPGRIIGFNSYVTTRTGTNWYWSAGKQAATFGQPDTWGDLLLAGSDAVLELADAKPGRPAILVAGQPLRLRVRDSDMNLSPTRPDKVMVTLKPAHGGQQIAVLEETGPSTGLFEGSVSTALSVGDDQPGALAVYEGERVDAVYLDQARGNGARNTELRLGLRFAAALIARVAPK